jgi:hypothetical protein
VVAGVGLRVGPRGVPVDIASTQEESISVALDLLTVGQPVALAYYLFSFYSILYSFVIVFISLLA